MTIPRIPSSAIPWISSEVELVVDVVLHGDREDRSSTKARTVSWSSRCSLAQLEVHAALA